MVSEGLPKGQMKNQKTKMPLIRIWRDTFKRLRIGLGTKIVLPYLLLTLVVAGVGAYGGVALCAVGLIDGAAEKDGAGVQSFAAADQMVDGP